MGIRPMLFHMVLHGLRYAHDIAAVIGGTLSGWLLSFFYWFWYQGEAVGAAAQTIGAPWYLNPALLAFAGSLLTIFGVKFWDTWRQGKQKDADAEDRYDAARLGYDEKVAEMA